MPRLREPPRGPDNMETHTMRLHLRAALREYPIRRTVWAVERIVSAIDVLDEMPEACLEEVRDYCAEYAKGHHDLMSDFKRAWVNLVSDHLNDMRERNRRLRSAITGEPH
jgi:hypothetical protein